MTGRINYTPEAQQQLDHLDDWITEASADVARRFISAILDHIDGILIFPLAGRARDDVRPGMRTVTFKRRTLIAVLGVFHGGQDWEAALGEDNDGPEVRR